MVISDSNLPALAENGVKVPSYDRNALRAKIAHIGLGHFHRSHFLTYLDDLLGMGAYDGGVFELDIIPVDKRFIADLEAQDWLYSVLSFAPDGKESLRINGPVLGYANETEDPDKVLAVLSAADTELITMTITEKGYKYLDDAQSIDWEDAGIIHDLMTDEPPVTAIGCLSRALAARSVRNLPVTVMSCDNLPENGRMLRRCVLQFCAEKYPEAVSWISSSVSFPCTMVDRITPGTGEKDIMHLQEAYGLEDRCPVHSEEFRQWVIEDDFSSAVPDFSLAGALVVKDVRPYELMKIRLLNGSHSALSYPAYMMGISMVHEAAGDSIIREFIRNRYMEEISATLPPVPGISIDGYKDELISRFSNPYIADTILRLASDGSKKIANAILRPLEELLRNRQPSSAVILALAIWEFYFIAEDADGNPMPVDDPKKDVLSAVAADPVSFLRTAGLAEDALSADLAAQMSVYMKNLREKGVKAVLEEYLQRR